MTTSPITPLEAATPYRPTAEEVLYDALNTLIRAHYQAGRSLVHQEDLVDLIGTRRWDVGTHPRTVQELLPRYEQAGWRIEIQERAFPIGKAWTFIAPGSVA